MEAGFDNGTLGIIDDQVSGNATEEFQCPTVAAQPGAYLLVGNELSVLMPAEGKGHDKEPGGYDLPGIDIDDSRAFAKIHLGGITGVKIQNGGDLRMIGFELGKKTA